MNKALEAEVNASGETILRSIEQHTAPYSVNIKGVPFVLFPTVFNPNYSKPALFFLDHLGVRKGDVVLDPFTGCGVDAIFAAKQGALSVVAIDKNKMAYLCTQYNALRLELDNRIDVRQGDSFDNSINEEFPDRNLSIFPNRELPLSRDEQFDLVVANPPFRMGIPHNIMEEAVRDRNYETLMGFFHEMTYNLKPDGRIRMVFSNIGDIPLMKEIAKDNGFKPKIVAQDKIGAHIIVNVYEMTR